MPVMLPHVDGVAMSQRTGAIDRLVIVSALDDTFLLHAIVGSQQNDTIGSHGSLPTGSM